MALSTQPSGYSGTPLAKKLGIKPGNQIKLVNAPAYYLDLFTDFPADVQFEDDEVEKDLIHFFIKQAEEFYKLLPQLKTEIRPDGTIWVSWPKKASKVKTDITENMIRDYAISIGLVDIKVCSVDEIWSGLKLVIPVKDRHK